MKGIKTAFALTFAAGIAGCATDAPVRTAATQPAPASRTQPAAAPAPKPATFTATLSADESFAAGKPSIEAKLTLAAKAKLDSEVVGKMKQFSRIDLVLVAGHTDRLSGSTDGQQLSEQQADAVLAYLKSQGMQAAVMDTMGFGKTLPVKECPSTIPQGELAACLAPNRRVEVEVKGMPQ